MSEYDGGGYPRRRERPPELGVAPDGLPLEDTVDGVPIFWLPGEHDRVTAELSFGVGLADEAFPTTGVTHLVAHLAMRPFADVPYTCNASVGPRMTTFTVRFIATAALPGSPLTPPGIAHIATRPHLSPSRSQRSGSGEGSEVGLLLGGSAGGAAPAVTAAGIRERRGGSKRWQSR